ncbi:hypothetical protein [Sagittula sp. S175]|uniref:hypothetical protein n=1 Tax=Sagittula sp. S175 TaxID=3415129 RepID=UPI003C7B93DE
MEFDLAHFEDHPNPVRHVLFIETISPTPGLFINAMTKVFGAGATVHYELLDDLDIVDGELVRVAPEPVSPETMLRRGVDKVKAAGATRVAFLHSGRGRQDIHELLSRLQGDHPELIVADWSAIVSM